MAEIFNSSTLGEKEEMSFKIFDLEEKIEEMLV